MIDEKEYLGDGAYVTFDGYHILLTAENGKYATDKIGLDPDVLKKFLKYVERVSEFKKGD